MTLSSTQKWVITIVILGIVLGSTFFLIKSLQSEEGIKVVLPDENEGETQFTEKEANKEPETKQEPTKSIKKGETKKACTDECAQDVCEGKKLVECVRSADGCKREEEKGYAKGKCGVSCVTNNDCSAYQVCDNYVCTRREAECGDDTCDIGEFGSCEQDCGESNQPSLKAYPAFLFDAQGILKNNVFIVIGNSQLAYHQDAAEAIVDDLEGVAENLGQRIKRANEVQSIQTKILVILGTECDNELLEAFGMQCSPFSVAVNPYIEIVGGANPKVIVYGNEERLMDSIDLLLSARERNVQSSQEQV